MLAATLLALAVGGGSADANPIHPNSISRLEIEVQDDRLQLQWWIPSRTLMEEPDVEFVGQDVWNMSVLEAETAWPRIRPYLEQGFTILVDGQPWQPEFETFTLELDGGTFFVETELPTGQRVTSVEVRIDHFFDGANPDHIMDTEVRGLSPEPDRWFFMWGRREAKFPVPPEPGYSPPDPLRHYMGVGWRHVLDGWDHLAFLAALLFGVLGWRAVLAAVTGFTIAHSITLGLTVWGILSPSPAWVEPGIALSISVVLWWHLYRGPADARAWIPAFGFGLLHGCSFATQISKLRIPESDLAASLLGFNIGVELGQLNFVVPVIATAYFGARLVGSARLDLARRWTALLLAAFALVLFGQALENYTPLRIDSLPTELAALPGVLGLTAVLIAIAGRRDAADGEQLRRQMGAAAWVASLYLAGTWLGS